MIKKIISHMTIGLAIGFVVTTISLWIFGLYNATGAEVMLQFTVWLFASALYGLVSLIYDTNVPFPLSLIIHFIACAAITFAASLITHIFTIIRWYEWFIYVLPFFIVIYIIIGASVSVASWLSARVLNKKMQNK